MDRASLADRLARSRPLFDPSGQASEPIYHIVIGQAALNEIIAALRGAVVAPPKPEGKQ